MIKTLNLLLLLVLIISSLYVVRLQHESRLLYTDIANESNAQEELELDYRRLQQDRQNLVTPWRIEQNAQSRLQMKQASLGVTQYIPVNTDAIAEFTPALPTGVSLSNDDLSTSQSGRAQ